VNAARGGEDFHAVVQGANVGHVTVDDGSGATVRQGEGGLSLACHAVQHFQDFDLVGGEVGDGFGCDQGGDVSFHDHSIGDAHRNVYLSNLNAVLIKPRPL